MIFEYEVVFENYEGGHGKVAEFHAFPEFASDVEPSHDMIVDSGACVLQRFVGNLANWKRVAPIRRIK